MRKFPAFGHALFFTRAASLGEAVSRAAVQVLYPGRQLAAQADPVDVRRAGLRNHRGTIVEPCRNLVNSYDFVILATSEPAWNHGGTMQEPGVFIWFRHTCDVGTIVEPSWNHAGTL